MTPRHDSPSTAPVTTLPSLPSRLRSGLPTRALREAVIAEFGMRALAVPDLQGLLEEGTRLLAQTLRVEYVQVLERQPDERTLLLRAGVGWKDGLVGHATVEGGRRSLAGFTLQTRKPVILRDLQAETRFDAPPLLTAHGVVAGVTVLIGKAGHPFGVLGVQSRRRRRFSLDDVHFLQAIANVLAAAAARLQAEAGRAWAEYEYADTVGKAPVGIVRSSVDGRILFANPAFARLLGYASPAELTNLDMARDVYADLHERATVVTRYARAEDPVMSELQLKRRDGTSIWVLGHARVVRDDAGRLQGFEAFVIDVSERHRLEAERDGLAHQLIELQEAERRHLAGELHDEIGQLLTGLRLMIEAEGALGGLEEMHQLVKDVIGRVRDVSNDLRPPMLDDLGLRLTLVWHVERFRQQTGIAPHLTTVGLERRFPEPVELAAFRIVQEALTNVARHAQVPTVEVDVRVLPGRLSLCIDDQGPGFDLSAICPSARGLRGMRERARLLGGTCTVSTAPGTGVRVTAELPLCLKPTERPIP